MQTLVAEILAAWRRAERLAGTLEPGSLNVWPSITPAKDYEALTTT